MSSADLLLTRAGGVAFAVGVAVAALLAAGAWTWAWLLVARVWRWWDARK